MYENQSLSCPEAVHNYRNTVATPSLFPVIRIAACKSTWEARWAQLCSQQLRQKLALRHNTVCSCFCAHLSLPPGHCSPACGAQGTEFHQGILMQRCVQPGPYSTAVTVGHPFLIPQLANYLLEAQKYIHHSKPERLYFILGSLLSSRDIPIIKRQPLM